MTLNELKIAVLDELDTIIASPVVDAEEVRQAIEKLFEDYQNGQKAA